MRCSRVWRNRVSVLPGPVLTPDFRKPPLGLLALATLGKTSLWTKVGSGGAVGVVCAPAALTAGGNADPHPRHRRKTCVFIRRAPGMHVKDWAPL